MFTVIDEDHFLLKLSDQGLCRETDPEIFFSESKSPDKYDQAKLICHRCPLEKDCFEYAVITRVSGCWGGTDEKQREDYRREARRQTRLKEEKEKSDGN